MDELYKDTLEFMYRQLPMYQREGAAALKKTLDNIRHLDSFLGHPHLSYKTIHVAGTNGKGSVCHYLASTLMEAGYKVGLYTSPHYLDFRERIKVNGKMITKNTVVKFIGKINDIINEIKPSFFEITVAMAFDHFRNEKIDVAVIETGLGGRLDSTNIINPILTVITNIGLDHQSMLGDTLQKIAVEKAGIMKKDVPCLIGRNQDLICDVFEKRSRSLPCPLHCPSEVSRDQPQSGHQPDYFTDNLSTVTSCKELLVELGINISDINLKDGIANVASNFGFIGRWQKLGTSPDIYADSAHNVDGISSLFNFLSKSFYPHIHIMLGMVSDKNHDDILYLLPKNATYYFCKANIPRGYDAQLLKKKASNHGLNGDSYSSVKEALAAAKNTASSNDLVLVTGSIFTVAEAM